MKDTFDDFLQKQVRRVRQSLRPPNRDADFQDTDEVVMSSRGNTKGRMGHKCPASDSQEGAGGILPGKRRRETPKDRVYWDYYKEPTTGARFPWK